MENKINTTLYITLYIYKYTKGADLKMIILIQNILLVNVISPKYFLILYFVF